jgi:hypothetical protein
MVYVRALVFDQLTSCWQIHQAKDQVVRDLDPAIPCVKKPRARVLAWVFGNMPAQKSLFLSNPPGCLPPHGTNLHPPEHSPLRSARSHRFTVAFEILVVIFQISYGIINPSPSIPSLGGLSAVRMVSTNTTCGRLRNNETLTCLPLCSTWGREVETRYGKALNNANLKNDGQLYEAKCANILYERTPYQVQASDRTKTTDYVRGADRLVYSCEH